MAVIECKNVGIRYIKGDMKSIGLKEYISRHINHTYCVEEFWADKDITFSIDKGDMLGIIGPNGSGKSTLLKAVAGIMEPVAGTVRTRGKIAALLELASGFDNDMTVRENVFLRGALLGYSERFLKEKYDEIIAFAELEEFQDYAFKQLSSGMKSRLAFSIACLVNPDILILDEVLSVGDGAFRKKSGEKMMEIIHSGITGVLVSHSVDQVRELCNKILWLDHGCQVVFSNEVEFYCDAYEEYLVTHEMPVTREDFERLAIGHNERQEQARLKKLERQTRRLERILEKGEKSTAVEAALRIIRRNCPEILMEEYRLPEQGNT